MNSDKLLVSPHIDELELQVLDYKDDFEVFQKEKEQFELQKKTNLFDEKAQKEMELQIEKKKSELAANRTALLTSIDTALLKQDIDQTKKQQIETSKKEITQRDPNSSGGVREGIKKATSDIRAHPLGKLSIIGGGILGLLGLTGWFSKKEKEPDKEKNQEEEKSQPEEEKTSNEQENDKESEDTKPEEGESENKDEQEETKSDEEHPIDELNNKVEEATNNAGKTIDLFEKIGDWISKKAA